MGNKFSNIKSRKIFTAITFAFLGFTNSANGQTTSIPAVPCPACYQESNQGREPNECYYKPQGGFPTIDRIEYRGCAIPQNYSEYCANNQNLCKLLNPIRPPVTTMDTRRTIIGYCVRKKGPKSSACETYPRYRHSITQYRESSECQVTAYNAKCSSRGFLGPSITLDPDGDGTTPATTLVGTERRKLEILQCITYDDPACPDSPCPGYNPWPGGGGTGPASPGPGWPFPGPATPQPGQPAGGGGSGPPGGGSPGMSGPTTGLKPCSPAVPITGGMTCPPGQTAVYGLSKDECHDRGGSHLPRYNRGQSFRDSSGNCRIDTRSEACCIENEGPTTPRPMLPVGPSVLEQQSPIRVDSTTATSTSFEQFILEPNTSATRNSAPSNNTETTRE
jgi:hypothetical protein